MNQLHRAVLFGILAGLPAAAAVHAWEKQELTFTASRSYANPYTEVTVWVDLSGPHFNKRVYGFWDGGQTFRVRLVATEPGGWKWRSGSNPADPGLAGKSGSFTAVAWSAEEKQQNPLRRGLPARHAQQPCAGTSRRNPVPGDWGHVVFGGHQPVQVVRR